MYKFLSVSLRTSILLLIFIIAGFYFIGTNSLTPTGEDIKELKDRVYLLEKSNQDIELELSELNSLDKLLAESPVESLVKAGKIEYVFLENSDLAKK